MKGMLYTFRKFRHRGMNTKLRVPVIWLQHRGLRPTDVFVASFPRSGNHYLRFLLHEILTGKPAHFDTIKQALPWIHSGFRKASAVFPEGGRLISTHEQYRREYRKAIYLVRDVRDVVLSNYFSYTCLSGAAAYYNIRDFDTYLGMFLGSKMRRYGSWQEHVVSWLDCPISKTGDLLVIRFEDMRRNPEETLTRVAQFLGVHTDRRRILAAIDNNTLEKMRAKEDVSESLVRGDTEEGRFVRRGRVGGWRESLTEPQVELIQQCAGNVLARMGYSAGASVVHATNEAFASHVQL